MFNQILKKTLTYYVYRDWNIGIADISETLDPVNVKWMKHPYTDRWFADPFIVSENADTYIVLVEECLHSTGKGRLARLYISKENCELVKNETILELPSHLSFPNFIDINGIKYLYPENANAGSTKYYRYGELLEFQDILTFEALADAVIFENNGRYYMLATQGEKCNGNELLIFHSMKPLNGYQKFSTVTFSENIARRAGNTFNHNGQIISPAQVNNNDYGEGVSLQAVVFDTNDNLIFKEFKRIKPIPGKYHDGIHTYNVFGNKVVIDGYRYRSHILHKLYVKLRNPR